MISKCCPLLLALSSVAEPVDKEAVIFLHGLCRSTWSMKQIEKSFESAGYLTVNQGYPSRKDVIENLSLPYIDKSLLKANELGAERVHFVTHSMGGILLRYYLSEKEISHLGRVVMMAPPNQGSEVVDRIGHWKMFHWVNGPAGKQLGTDSKAIWNDLPEPDYPIGVIASTKSINWINSMMIAGVDDGKVSVARTKVKGMRDFCTVKSTHPTMLWSAECKTQALSFVQTGSFHHCLKKGSPQSKSTTGFKK